ncbi:MAG: TlpA family protein disulfide reductase [Methylocystis sp.]|nr:TlpA family protein disulfide reductase [Methylocystis sp.]
MNSFRWPARSTFWLLSVFLGFVASSAFALEFKPYGVGDFGKITKAHAGKPLILHYWSVTCPPCLAELPIWAKLLAERKDLDIIFVNADGEDDRARAMLRLEKAGLAQAIHYGFADSFVEKLYFEADKTWRGEMPFTALVAPDGAVTAVTGEVDEAFIARWLAKQSGK